MTRIPVDHASTAAAGGPSFRQVLTVDHCHLPPATPDCPTCVEVHGVEWTARARAERAAAAQLRQARTPAQAGAGQRTRRPPVADQTDDDVTVIECFGWRRGWDIDPAADQDRDAGWGDSA